MCLYWCQFVPCLPVFPITIGILSLFHVFSTRTFDEVDAAVVVVVEVVVVVVAVVVVSMAVVVWPSQT